jgi:hypothetical protein
VRRVFVHRVDKSAQGRRATAQFGSSVAVDGLIDAALTLAGSAATADFRGADPYDGLLWNWPGPVVAGRRRRQALVQLHARLPVDIRRPYRRDDALIP